ncbi:hypothetical protein [Rhizobium terrae]|uniref:hypothetical protein n=1 Tax=Rhizobium terrae TaxID=2171756 RepID=UPI0013C314E7|nr:hypothetical protein [Rhizobium terrae]
MKATLTGLLTLLMCSSFEAAGWFVTAPLDVPAIFAQDRGSLAQRYVCVVPPDRNGRDRGAKVCSTYFGPIGSSCRCQNVAGNGRVQRAN